MDIDEINRLQAQIDALQNQLSEMRADAEPERASRRGMLKLAAGAAVGAVAGGLALGANPAFAGATTPPHEHFYSISPTRVYDSRWTGAQSSILSSRLGRLNPNTGRSVDLGRGRNANGTITNSQLLPPKVSVNKVVSAVVYNLTATGGTGVNFLSVSPGDATERPSTSAINYSANQNIANGGIVQVSWDATLRGVGDYQMFVWNGDDVGSTHFVVDITGFYWYDSADAGPPSPWSRP
ncbi:MAG: hypothetical protein ACKOJ9_03110 [Actinomycetota bacterium]